MHRKTYNAVVEKRPVLLQWNYGYMLWVVRTYRDLSALLVK